MVEQDDRKHTMTSLWVTPAFWRITSVTNNHREKSLGDSHYMQTSYQHAHYYGNKLDWEGSPGGSQSVSSAVFASSNSPLSRPILDKFSGASSRERPECAFPVEVNMRSRQNGRPNTRARAKVLESDPRDHMDEALEGTADYSDLAAIRRELDNLRRELATLKVSGTSTGGNSAARQLPVHMGLDALEKHNVDASVAATLAKRQQASQSRTAEVANGIDGSARRLSTSMLLQSNARRRRDLDSTEESSQQLHSAGRRIL
ncbi:hypothetical protein M514_13276 [Trichuris suis]|uniref:Uncharacterized protein n=1 Tax=Trichuris suis TaxID=68888 RepID=A0A085MTE7_9BILA|nr:hypothetical protein M514_13276 [Trichuris suis]